MKQVNYNKDVVQQEIVALSEKITTILDSYRNLQQPLQESQEKVPCATKQLDKISEQTEAAAQKMLDTVELLTQRQENMIAEINQLKTVVIKELPNQNSTFDRIIAQAETNNDSAFQILDALQFQDITAQQINYAVQMLVELEIKLSQIVTVMRGEVPDQELLNQVKNQNQRAFDPHADMVNAKTNQSDIDNLFMENKKN